MRITCIYNKNDYHLSIKNESKKTLKVFQIKKILIIAGFFLFSENLISQGRYMEVQEFLDLAFIQQPQFSSLWVDQETRDTLKEITGKDFNQLRVRYWESEDKTAWVLQEVGKEELITVGIVVYNGSIQEVRVLEFKEPRGWEIRYPFFTDQYRGIDADRLISNAVNPIHGITGATLSVEAVNRMAKTALILDRKVTLPNS